MGGAIIKHTTRETVEQTIFSKIHNKRYTMAREAPICNGKLFDKFGYTANMTAARAVLGGTYIPPEGSDQATLDLFVEKAKIFRRIPQDSVSICITPQQWKQYWKVVNKETLSLESCLHFGHYIVGCTSDIITHYYTARVSVVIPHAIQLDPWSRGLLVMLEKTLGVTLVTKLRAILLMETYFNATNKIIYVWGQNGCRRWNGIPAGGRPFSYAGVR